MENTKYNKEYLSCGVIDCDMMYVVGCLASDIAEFMAVHIFNDHEMLAEINVIDQCELIVEGAVESIINIYDRLISGQLVCERSGLWAGRFNLDGFGVFGVNFSKLKLSTANAMVDLNYRKIQDYYNIY